MIKHKFKVGDIVTFKSFEDCGGNYCYGGYDFGGYKGTVVQLNESSIIVTCPDGKYQMLESEFEEYDKPFYEVW